MLLGETGNIVHYGFVPSEAFHWLIPMYNAVAERIKGEAVTLKAIYTDTCCFGADDQEKILNHLLKFIFKNVERGPFLDLMHFLKRFTEQMDQGSEL